MVDIGNKIKELRTEQKMTQSDLAERLGVTKSSISSYENGSRLPSYDILLKIARIFKVSTDILKFIRKNAKNKARFYVSGIVNRYCFDSNFICGSVGNYQPN
jgi:transcriptional regulator with XRE-family HTH domain